MNKTTFRGFLTKKDEELIEQSHTRKGDYPYNYESREITKTVIDLKWKLVDTVTIKEITYQIRNLSLDYVIGSWEGDAFVTYGELSLRNEKINGKIYKAVDLVQIKENLHGSGLETVLYKSLVNKEGIELVSDSVQYFGARKLWERLSKETDVTVDILGVSTNMITPNVVIDKGSNNFADKRIWHFNKNNQIAKNIRLILRSID